MNRINGIPVIGIDTYLQMSGLVSATSTTSINVSGAPFNVLPQGMVFTNEELRQKTLAEGVFWSSDILVYEMCRYDPADPPNERVNINRWTIEPSGNVAFVKPIAPKVIPGHRSPNVPERYLTSGVQVY